MVSSSVCDCCIHTDVVKLVGEAVERIGDDVEALKDFQMSVTVSCPHYMTKPNLRY